jgi:hypothetical protein
MEYQLDMNMMFAIHDALRRDLVQVARVRAGGMATLPAGCTPRLGGSCSKSS